MSGGVCFRGFSGHDLERVAELEDLDNPIPWTLESLRDFTESSDTPLTRFGRLAVLEESGDIAGYVCVQSTGEEAEILILGVASEYRRRGIGQALLLDLRAFLRARGCGRLLLEVRWENWAALSLYLSVGFIETGIRKRYYADTGGNARLMQWDLSG